MQRYEIIGKLANVRATQAVVARQADSASHTGRCKPHKQIEKRRTKYPLPSHILSYSETSPKERECSNGKVRQTMNEQKTNNEQTKDEQKTNKRRRKDEEKTKKRRRKDEQWTKKRRRKNEQWTKKRRRKDEQTMAIRRN